MSPTDPNSQDTTTDSPESPGTTAGSSAGSTSAVHRVVVYPQSDQPDPLAREVLDQSRAVTDRVTSVRSARVFLIEAPFDQDQLQRVASELLADPINQQARTGSAVVQNGSMVLEVHYKPGVMDPVAQSTQQAILEMFPALGQVNVRTGFRYEFDADGMDSQQLTEFATRYLANTVIQDICLGAHHPQRFETGSAYDFKPIQVPLTNLDDQGLTDLSRNGHLFLSLEEMQAIKQYFQQAGREPTDIELESLAQTWSEHCVHKTLKSTIHYQGRTEDIDFASRPGHTLNDDGSVTIQNLLKSTIAAATFKLMEQDHYRDWCLSVFEDNAGIVRLDQDDAVCIKVETHNHPSAIEPYGGAATGVGGCIRDVMGTGLSAKPIANTDVFCVAFPRTGNDDQIPKGVIRPQRILQQVVAGVRDYGNRMGIPTVNGAVYFHDDYLGNPLVFCGCVGLLPADKAFGTAQPGDHIIALGGATGRDGIHGATFSSAELTDSHADEFSHAVQIGNAITEKKTLDVILQARDYPGGPLFSAITDCGAGGFSSAVGEMGQQVGAEVHLDRAPLKYQGLSYTEIWISEAQERMVLAVPTENTDTLRQLCDAENVEYCDLGTFGQTSEDDMNQPMLVLHYRGQQVGRMGMQFLHDGLPTPTRSASWTGQTNTAVEPASEAASKAAGVSLGQALHKLLAHPNIASKHWIIRQYDHEVQGGSVIKPLVGPAQDGPSDGAVLRPKLDSSTGVAISCGLQTGMGEKAAGGGGDSYWMTLAAIDEAVRNCVCVGADPSRIAILDNFCWPSCDDPQQLGALVRAAEACYDGALAYCTPFVSGKDSLNNQFTTDDGQVIAIPSTLLITALGVVSDVTRCVSMDGKSSGNLLLQVGHTTDAMGGSHYTLLLGAGSGNSDVPRTALKLGPAIARAVAGAIGIGVIESAHDCSDGGMLAAAAEMAFAGRVGLDLDLDALESRTGLSPQVLCFAESPSRILLEVAPAKLDALVRHLRDAEVPFCQVGRFTEHNRLTLRNGRSGSLLDEDLDALRASWLGTLDW